MKKTPLYDKHVADGAKMVEFAGYMMPIQFAGIMEEHHKVREDVGVFDVSHMGEIIIEGDDAEAFLEQLMTNNVGKMKAFTCMYTIMCYENGMVVDDLLIYKYSSNKYLLVVNASNDEKDYQWIDSHSKDMNVIIDHCSDGYGELAVQGPNANELLRSLIGDCVDEISFFTFKEVQVDQMNLLISRTGYTGEDGFELFVDAKETQTLYDKLFHLEGFSLSPIGLGARDTLRFEVALPLYGHEISDEINPVEARLSYFIDFDTDFIGKSALMETANDENRRTLIGFQLQDRGIAREHYPIVEEGGTPIGHVTTGYKLDGYDGSIGLGLVPKKYSKLGSTIYIQIRKKIVPAKVIKRKFYQKKYKKDE